MIALPGADSYRVTGMPSRSRTDARKSAAFRVSPGGLEVSIATYWLGSLTASSELPVWLVAITEDTEETKDTEAAFETATDEQTEAADTAARNLQARSAV